jgi:CBS domain-containing protein
MHIVEDAMTVDVVTVGPDEPFTVAARIMCETGVSGLPVVDASGEVIGILTEADLLLCAAQADLSDIDDRRGSRNRSRGSTVADLMSREVLGIRRDEPLTKAAGLMEKARVRRLVVVGPGFGLEGIISRSDVVAALARSDADIEEEIRSCVIGELLGLEPDDVDVSVDQGIVTLAGVVPQRRDAVRLERLAAKVLGVSGVESSVTWKADTVYPGLAPRFAYFAKRREGSRTRTKKSKASGNNNEDSGAEPVA